MENGVSAASFARLRLNKGLSWRMQKAGDILVRTPREALSPAGQWLLDHGPFLLEEAQALERDVRRGVKLPGEKGVPRILTLARQIVAAGDGEVTSSLILRTARAFADQQEGTQEEWDHLRLALSCALLEEIDKSVVACLTEEKERRQARRWARRFVLGRARNLPLGNGVLEKGLAVLAEKEAERALRRADTLMRREGRPMPDSREASVALGARTGRLILSLRHLPAVPFDRLLERLNPVSAILRQEDTYRRMDDAGRAYYRQCVEHLAKKYTVSEPAVARAALALTEEKTGVEAQAGYYLTQRPDLIAQYLLQRPARFSLRRRTALFLLPLYGSAFLSLAGAVSLGMPVYTWPLIVLCVSEIVRSVYFPLLRRHVPARPLPRLHLRNLTEETRTLVAVPTLLTSRKQALRMAKHLAVLRCANPDKYLDFLLLADFADADKETLPEDEEILRAAAEAIDALNETGGGGFYYLHRGRQWNGEAFTGRERKRGAIDMLNHLLTDGQRADAVCYSSFSLSLMQNRYRYVITLDADTFLPPGAACQLVGAMEHPLQKDRVGVIQPRMEVQADTVVTGTQALWGGLGGVDVYGGAAQDVYQDVFGRGSFVGKGIYRPGQWRERVGVPLAGHTLLSHDLIEGEFAQSALASDIVLYDGHPRTLSGWQKRLHRWTRGDWQLLPFLLDRRLSLLSRHKIADNLRRSLVPFAQTALLILGMALGQPALALLGLPWPLRGMLLRLAVLPGKAYTLLDAAVRAVHRRFISHRHLLAWVTAAQAEGGQLPLPCVLAQVAAGAGMTVFSLLPGAFWPGALVGMLWLAGLLVVPLLDRPRRLAAPMTEKQKAAMRRLARDTWGFFVHTVNEHTLFLPPDNVQSDPRKGPALRTSPTNIGLYLLSCCAAREMGFLTTAELCRRLGDTLTTLRRLDTWKGHFYNWYDLTDGAPLPPLFVSTVDSGNLAGCLFACAQYCRKLLAEMPEEYQNLPARMDALFTRMDFAVLYDAHEKLFYVGVDAPKGRPTPAHYDLMASEERLTSYLAVMTGQVPLRHWRHLNRSVTRAGGGPALLSWGGTMFEYLMPHLLLPLTPGTLLGEGCLSAIRAQVAHQPRRPFGISESGYYAFDADMNYQYRAFGLPALALTGETAGQVIAPYASALALPFLPRTAADNIQRMQALGWADEEGLYEAADYSQGKALLVRSHMAHHQGMVLCALCNALENNALVRAFMAPPAAQAYGYLLWEKAPRYPRRRTVWPRDKQRPALPGPCRRTPRTGLPVDAHALVSGHLTWVLSARGQGYLAWKDVLLTRFDPNAGNTSGMQIYVRDSASQTFIRPAAVGRPRFESGSVHYTAAWENMKITLSCCCAPLTTAAVARLTVENTGKNKKEIEAVSFLEVALSTEAEDAAHPNFRDLSVRVSPWGRQGLTARRLPRDEKEKTPLLAHMMLGDAAAPRRQGDKSLFLGRMGTIEAPEQIGISGDQCRTRLGDVIAPCLSLRARISLQPGEKRTVYFVTMCRENEEELADEHLLRLSLWQDAFSLAYTQDQMALRALRMGEDALHLYQQVLGAVAFTGQPHQALLPTASRQALWRLGVSGALPVWAVALEKADQPLIRHALRCHGWLRNQGVKTDLVFLCPEETEYRRPIWDAVNHLLSVSPSRHLAGVPGGVTLTAVNREDAAAAESLCRLVLHSGKPMKEQLRLLTRPVMEGSMALAVPQPIAPLKWQDENSFGGFTAEGDYGVVRPAPAPWHNLLCNDHFGTLVCETGILHSYFGNSRLGRVTRLNPDVHRGVPSEEIYLRDEQGNLYPLTRPTALHSPGVTEYRCLCGTVFSDLTVFTHVDRPAGIRALKLRSERGQRVTVYWAVRFALGEAPDATRCRVQGSMALAENGDLPGTAWAAVQGTRCRILPAGLYGLPVLDGQESGGGSVALFSWQVDIKPRGQEKALMALGFASGAEQALADSAALLQSDAGNMERQVRLYWQEKLGKIMLFAGQKSLERMMNIWLPYQAITARLLARMGPYQAGGAYGFRDQLQDLLVLLHTDADFARGHILLCAAHQFPEGDVQHWWHAPHRGVRTRISDDKLFLPYLTAQYVRITGDDSILLARAPYLESMPLLPEEKDRYEEPMVTSWDESLLQHCVRAIDSVQYGEHGLPLMGGGDWNDGMNAVGGQRGESVWLGFFLAAVLKDFGPLCDREEKEKYLALRRQLLDAAESAWTGQWYLRAWYDDGTPLGGPNTKPPRIDLISQAFAVLAGAPKAHARTALMQALRLLYDREAGLVKLLDPPFTPEESAGYIGAYLPGVRENGGQYTHAVPWLILALCKAGEYEWAWEIARVVLPTSHGDSREKAMTYKLEPYVLAGDVYAGENRGRGGWSWYTGSAAWLYHVILTALLGFEKRGSRVRLTPCPGGQMEEFTLIYIFGASRYHFTASRDVVFPTLDGEKLQDGWVILTDDGKTHDARYPLKS
ncbi:MAG: hypothetical protein IJ189_05570 [Clostridia bacterium]|nr:hypothetical protein [Clostridia bacterium]